MAVNLSKNGPALTAAYKKVVDAKSDTDWALFTYEGNSNDLRLVETGGGGLEELVEELNSGKIMYAFCRVPDPNSGLPKYVLINWTGEGVKDSRKGMCANHLSSIANFLKGAHVTINARTEEDVEPETILNKVAKASGANYNFHKQQNYIDPPREQVGSVYRKINAVVEIQQTNKDNFWDQTQRDEEVWRKEESRRAEQERQKLERERRDLDEKQAKERERRAKERTQQIEQQQMLEKKKEEEEKERELLQLQENTRKVTGINAAASVQKANEAKSLISQRSFNPRDIFKQKEQSFEVNNKTPPAASRPGKLQSTWLKSFETQTQVEPQSPTPEQKSLSLNSFSSGTSDLSAFPAAVVSPTPPQTTGLDEQPEEEAEWSDEFDDDADEHTPVGSPVQYDLYQAPDPVQSAENLYEDFYQDTTEAEEAANNGKGCRARALYDYQAADDTEITFDPDDIITDIEMLDEGWWRGYGPDGHYGLFPANYVEVISD
ncbi:PREDICTED: drebrin-like protein B isoform X2 [Cyprinodon variegatus]|uniref:drebrin-like protein B isoform X2 n=1 Tax=Cyprinodon variegatus TaxID=28743 RepID=UPI0007427C0C|nr:PREDICTED: drebrin-like protein B isoform X2 [Cyprinodon variegatus]